MKRFLFLSAFVLTFYFSSNAQGIGEMAPEKPPTIFPNNTFGLDIIFSEGGFGLGTFYRRQLSKDFTAFVDFSVSEAKDDNEIQYIDYYGNPYTIGKKNRIFLMPLNLGVQYRLFQEEISDNLRPYINGGVGPTLIVTTPYELEFFDSFGSAKSKFAMGAYIGLGANFGLDKKSLLGLNIRYYFIHLFDEGVESLYGKYKKDMGGLFLTINLGLMY